MLHNIEFEICSLVFLFILILFYYAKYRLAIHQNRLFGVHMVFLSLAIFTNLFTLYMEKNLLKVPMIICELLLVVSYVFLILFIFFFYMYIVSITGHLLLATTFVYKLLAIPALTCIIAICFSMKTKSIFYYNDAGTLIKSAGYSIIPITILFYITTATYTIIKNKTSLRLKQLVTMFIYVGMYFLALVIQYIMAANELHLFYFIVTLATVYIYISKQNPDYYISFSNGLLNRDAFKLMIKENLEYNTPFNCISIQLDEFTSLSEIYGINRCDELVNCIGTFLKTSFPLTDIFAISNTQFIIIDKDKIDFNVYDNVVSERFSSRWMMDGVDIKLNKSMCCLSYPEFYGNIDELIGIIKFALEESFKTNTMVIIGDYIINKMNHNIAVEKAVERAIESNAIQVYYQPIYSAKEKKITSAEALARLFDDELGFIPPDEFIKVAEESGSILRLGQQIFEKVCVFIKNNDLQKYGISYIEVNLSPIQCMQRELATDLIAIADSYGLPMSCFNLEITESATTESKDHVKINMELLSNQNTTFSLDDYGTGFSNITAIMELPFEYVKIDKSIVWAYFDNTNYILEHLIHMFKKENLYIISEGVETEEQCHKLIEMGCDYLQGFYFSKAIPGDDFISYISV